MSQDSHNAHPGLSLFPDELKLEVFAYVRSKEDLCNVRLVCREWDTLVSPILWSSIKLDVEDGHRNQIGTLLYSDRQVLKHVRKFDMSWHGNSTENILSYKARVLLGGFENDSLEEFVSDENCELDVILRLFQTQSKLKKMSFDPIFEDLTSNLPLIAWIKEHSAWMVTRMTQVTHLRLFIPEYEYHQGYKLARLFLYNTPNIETLWLDGQGGFDDQAGILEQIFGTLKTSESLPWSQLQLKTLRLSSMGVCSGWQPIFKGVDFSILEGLVLSRCEDSGEFLHYFENHFLSNQSRLTSIEIILNENDFPSSPLRAAESAISSITGLRSIVFYSGRQEELLSKECILRHCNTLRILMVSAPEGDPCSCYSEEELKGIVESCQLLEQLAINLPHANLGSITECDVFWGLQTDDRPETELQSMLSIIAMIPKLHTFRDVSAVNYLGAPSEKDLTPYKEIMLDNYANEVFKFLAGHGSMIKVLALSPFHTASKRRVKEYDMNGHRYPHYYYVRGSAVDIHGNSNIVAVPKKNCRIEMAESTILKH